MLLIDGGAPRLVLMIVSSTFLAVVGQIAGIGLKRINLSKRATGPTVSRIYHVTTTAPTIQNLHSQRADILSSQYKQKVLITVLSEKHRGHRQAQLF